MANPILSHSLALNPLPNLNLHLNLALFVEAATQAPSQNMGFCQSL
jgi:hypothetical protein